MRAAEWIDDDDMDWDADMAMIQDAIDEAEANEIMDEQIRLDNLELDG